MHPYGELSFGHLFKRYPEMASISVRRDRMQPPFTQLPDAIERSGHAESAL
jgi:hypothetical protein